MFSDKNSINLFWTGGWDSTFRLLQLLLVEHKFVKPYYVIDHKRISTGKELETMAVLKIAVKDKYPHEYSYLLPTTIHHRLDISPDPSITENFRRLVEVFPVGGQAEWLRRFIADLQLDTVELCWEKRIPVNGKLLETILDHSTGTGHECKLNTETIEELEFFRCYRFPLAHMTKTDMHATAVKYGFADILDNTWFCHYPKLNSIPCGICDPCKQVINYGMEYRIPALMRFRSKLHKFRKSFIPK